MCNALDVYWIIILCNALELLVMISIFVPCIVIKFLMISIVVQCIAYAYDKHSVHLHDKHRIALLMVSKLCNALVLICL